MKNGYFQLVNMENGYGIKLVPPTDGGSAISINEVISYLDPMKIDYDLPALNKLVTENKEGVFFLGAGQCPTRNEEYRMEISPNLMQVVVRFYPPSQTGKRMPMDEFVRDLKFRKIVFGVQVERLQKHFTSKDDFFCDFVIAKGKPPRQGTDARIEYFFNTDINLKPTMQENGSVDYFHLDNINSCKKGDLLAKIIPADEGDFGSCVNGAIVKPKTVNKLYFAPGKNYVISEDRLEMRSDVDGHVRLVEGEIFVSDVYTVDNVDLSTGNIEYHGSVQVNGNVNENMRIVAGGNVIVNGVVEGAEIVADGDIVIARGMNGMAKGKLKAGGNIITKFLESVEAHASGYISTESILHSEVSASTTIEVGGKKGFITGGHVVAGNEIVVKNLGAEMGATTIVEVGANPEVKALYIQLQKDVAECIKQIKNVQPVITNFTEKKAKGVRFTETQLEYVKNCVKLLEVKKKELEEKNVQLQEIQQSFQEQKRAQVIVKGMVTAGTSIVIGDVAMSVQKSYQNCKFVKKDGEVQMLPLL